MKIHNLGSNPNSLQLLIFKNMKTFTKENENELRLLISDSILNKCIYSGPIGQEYDVFDLVNGMSVSSLRNLSQFVCNKISKLSVEDEWIDNPNADLISELETEKNLISLIIGWKLHQQDLNEKAREKERLTKQLNDLVESQKTPEDLIAELKAKISELG